MSKMEIIDNDLQHQYRAHHQKKANIIENKSTDKILIQ